MYRQQAAAYTAMGRVAYVDQWKQKLADVLQTAIRENGYIEKYRLEHIWKVTGSNEWHIQEQMIFENEAAISVNMVVTHSGDVYVYAVNYDNILQ